MALKSIIWKVVRWGGALFFASSILSVILLRFLPVYVTPLMFIRTFQQLGSGESVVWHHHWVPLDSAFCCTMVLIMMPLKRRPSAT